MTPSDDILTEKGRLKLAELIVDDGWVLWRAAERFGVSVTTAQRWAGRYRQHGRQEWWIRRLGHGTAPSNSRVGRRTASRGYRITNRWGPPRIGYHFGLNPSAVHKVLTRDQCPRLKCTDPATGSRIKTSRAQT